MFGLFETFFESEAKSDWLVLPSSCVSFSFVFSIYFFIFYKFRFKRNSEKRSNHGSQNRTVELRFERFPTFLA